MRLQLLLRPIQSNPLALHLIGLCPALAISRTLLAALTIAAVMAAVLVSGSLLFSLMRRQIPRQAVLVTQITVLSALVILADQILLAYAYELRADLSIFVLLIAVNGLVLTRIGQFALRNPPLSAVLDATGHAAAFALILLPVGAAREMAGEGALLGTTIFPAYAAYAPELMRLAPGALILIGFLFWGFRRLQMHHAARGERRE